MLIDADLSQALGYGYSVGGSSSSFVNPFGFDAAGSAAAAGSVQANNNLSDGFLFSPTAVSEADGSASGGDQIGRLNSTNPITNNNGSNILLINTQSRPYFGDALQHFQSVYWPIHCVICLVICTLGIFANVTNIIVLTRPNMVSAVNTILSAMAFTDLVVNISSIPYLIHELSDSTNLTSYHSFQWAVYILIHAHTSVTAHTISIWLTCALATWRYFVVCRSQSSNQRNWSVGLAKRTVIGVSLFVPCFCIPNYLCFSIVKDVTEKNNTIYRVGFSQLAEKSDFIKTFHFWIFSCLTKLVPCVLLSFFTTVLIRKLLKARERRLRLATFGNNRQTSKELEENQLDSETHHLPNGGRDSLTPFGEPQTRPTGSTMSSRKISSSSNKQQQQQQPVVIDGVKMRLDNDSMIIFKEHNHCSRPSAGRGGAGGVEMVSRRQPPSGVKEPSASLSQKSSNNNNNNNAASNFNHQTSGSSCATNTENEVIKSSNSDAGSTTSATAAVLDDSIQTRKPARVMSQLIVESNANNTATSTKMLAGSVASDMQSAKADHQPTTIYNNLLPPPTPQSLQASSLDGPRPASTCGPAEFYPNSDIKQQQQQQQLRPLILSSMTASQELPPTSLAKRQQKSSINSNNTGNFLNNSTANIMDGGLPARTATSNLNFKLAEKRSSETIFNGLSKSTNDINNTRGRSIGSTTINPIHIVKIHADQKQLSQNETTTKLLIAVMIVFLICDFPPGILAALCAILGQDFWENVYHQIGSVTDLLALINSSVNFILYCFMSTQFRITFYRVVLHCPAPNSTQNKQQQQQLLLHKQNSKNQRNQQLIHQHGQQQQQQQLQHYHVQASNLVDNEQHLQQVSTDPNQAANSTTDLNQQPVSSESMTHSNIMLNY